MFQFIFQLDKHIVALLREREIQDESFTSLSTSTGLGFFFSVFDICYLLDFPKAFQLSRNGAHTVVVVVLCLTMSALHRCTAQRESFENKPKTVFPFGDYM